VDTLIKLLLLAPITILCTSCASNSTDSIPQPTKTVYVPSPESQNNLDYHDELNADLDTIKQENCRLGQDLVWQSLDLENQARELERQATDLGSDSDLYFKLKNQARDMQDQAIQLMFKSMKLRDNC
jgi:hypothetical protein